MEFGWTVVDGDQSLVESDARRCLQGVDIVEGLRIEERVGGLLPLRIVRSLNTADRLSETSHRSHSQRTEMHRQISDLHVELTMCRSSMGRHRHTRR